MLTLIDLYKYMLNHFLINDIEFILGNTSQSESYVTLISSAANNASTITPNVNKNTTKPLFISLVIVTTILGMICVAYIAAVFIQKQWNRTQK